MVRGLYCGMLAWALAACFSGAVFAEPNTEPSRLSLGANVIGAQIGYNISHDWRVEMRTVTGKQNADAGKIRSQVSGLRGYRLFGSGATRFYLGAEAGYVVASQENSSYRATGAVAGGFLGVERRLTRRIWIGVDAGPYYFSLKEKATQATDKGMDFVLNSAVMFYIF